MRKGSIVLIILVILSFMLPASPVRAAEVNQSCLQLQSVAAVLIDADSGQVLYAKNMHNRMFPASITKVMTGLLVLEKGGLDSIITMSADAVYAVERGSSHIALDVGETISVRDALFGMSIESANDAANGLAEYVGGSMTHFAELMNERAKAAGALNTHFSNANGLPDTQHYTTAYDMARITMAAVKTPLFLDYFGATAHTIPTSNKQPEVRKLHSSNAFLTGIQKLDGVVASKTGYTIAARHTLITVVRRGGRTLIAVVMRSEAQVDKWQDTIKLVNYGFNQFKPVTITCDQMNRTGVACTDAAGQASTLNLTSSGPVTVLLNQNITPDQVVIDYVLPADLSPSSAGTAKAVLKVADKYSGITYPVLAEVPLAIDFAKAGQTTRDSSDEKESSKSTLVNVSGDPTTPFNAGGQPLLARAGMLLLRILLGALGLLAILLVGAYVIHRKRLRRRRRLLALRRTMAPSARSRFDY
jgi:D-alanyl-D-alanine carboxypeptidase (penicillin-binding protein 5/6)